MANNNNNNHNYDDMDNWANIITGGLTALGVGLVAAGTASSYKKSQIKKRIQEIDEKLAELERHPFWNASEISQLKQERAQLAAKL